MKEYIPDTKKFINRPLYTLEEAKDKIETIIVDTSIKYYTKLSLLYKCNSTVFIYLIIDKFNIIYYVKWCLFSYILSNVLFLNLIRYQFYKLKHGVEKFTHEKIYDLVTSLELYKNENEEVYQ